MHTFPGAAMSVGGDPMDVHVERFTVLLQSAVDVENWKAGESDDKRRDRLLMSRLDGLVKE